jgi:hypothetical protein
MLKICGSIFKKLHKKVKIYKVFMRTDKNRRKAQGPRNRGKARRWIIAPAGFFFKIAGY